jgi:hypothetical protein
MNGQAAEAMAEQLEHSLINCKSYDLDDEQYPLSNMIPPSQHSKSFKK